MKKHGAAFYIPFVMKYLISVLLVFVALLMFGQVKYDYNWFVATSPQPDPDYGMTRIDFNQDTLFAEKVEGVQFDVDATNVSWSDGAGDFQWFSNGCVILNKDFEIMENGDSINAGEYHDGYCNHGYIVFQGAVTLPRPGNDSEQYLFHVWLEELPGSFHDAQKLLFTHIDMTGDGGLGVVMDKNQTVVHDTIAFGQLTAVKHANGEDWWLVMPENSTNGYYKILLDGEGPEVHGKQNIGTVQDKRDWGGQAVFSPDGSCYFRADGWSGIEVMDFDRCSGTLYNARHIALPFEEGHLVGAAISPNSRYAYVSSAYELVQYDLWADDIAATADTVGIYDGFQSWLPAYFFMMQLGPDGRIYMTTGNGTNVLHVIQNPDEAGDSCNFEQHAVTLPPYYGFAGPNFPNYRLGAVPPGHCDSVTVAVEEAELPGIEAWPNPASTRLYISGAINGKGHLTLYDQLGRAVYKHRFTEKESTHEINVENWNPGIYHCVFYSGETNEQYITKLVVSH